MKKWKFLLTGSLVFGLAVPGGLWAKSPLKLSTIKFKSIASKNAKPDALPKALKKFKGLNPKPISGAQLKLKIPKLLKLSNIKNNQTNIATSGNLSDGSLFSQNDGVVLRPFRFPFVRLHSRMIGYLHMAAGLFSRATGYYSLNSQSVRNFAVLSPGRNYVYATFYPRFEAGWQTKSKAFMLRIIATDVPSRIRVNNSYVSLTKVGTNEWAGIVSVPNGMLRVYMPPTNKYRLLYRISLKRFE